MAIASVGTLGTAANSTSASSFALTTATNTLAAGDFALLVVVTDNIATTDGNSNTHTAVSGGAGTWTELAEYTNTVGGAAGDGVCTSVWLFEANGAVPTGTSITISTSAATVDKAASMWKFTKAAGATIVQAASAVLGGVDASAGFGSASFTGLASAERLYFRGIGKEANSTTGLTVSAGFSAITNTRSRNNASAVGVWGEFRVDTSTGETSNPTLAVTGDTAGVFLALIEATNGAAPGTTLTASASLVEGVASATASATAAGATLTASASLVPGAATDGSAPPRVHFVIYPASKSTPSAAQIKAGQDVDGASAVAAGFEDAPTTSGVFTFSAPASGLTPATSYRVAFVWSSGAAESNVAVSDAQSTLGGDASAAGATVTATASLVAGSASGQRNASAAGATLAAAASLIAGAASGQINGAASGATLTATATLAAGIASGASAATAAGQTLTATASLVAGAAAGIRNATAAGQTLAASSALIAGSASGTASATAAGATLTAAASLAPGAATGAGSSTAVGATLTATASLISGAASGQRNASAAGATLSASASIVPGAASGVSAATGQGALISVTASLIPGAATATGSQAAPGQTLTATASLVPGAAAGQVNAATSGVTLSASTSITPGAAAGQGNGTAGSVILAASASLLQGGASAVRNETAAGFAVTVTVSMVAGVAVGGVGVTEPAPAWRTLYVEADARALLVAAEDRTLRVPQ